MKTATNKVTLTQARKVLSIVDAGLSHGLGNPKPGEMCVEAAVCYALGLPHGDDPECVHPAVRSFKIALNDSRWPSNDARARGMRELAIAQLGTNDASFDGKVFISVLVTETIRQMLPIALRALLKFSGLEKWHEQIEAAAKTCEVTPNLAAAQAARDLAKGVHAAAADAADAAAAAAAYAYAAAAADAYAYAAAADAAAAAAYAYAAAAADAYAADADAAAAAADAYAYAAADAAAAAADAYAADAAAARDSILSLCARIGIQALRASGAHGIKLLDQINKDAS